MRIPYIAVSTISFLFFTLPSILLNLVEANSTLDLLELPSKESSLASKSILTAIIPINNSILAVGERGHIINWQSDDNWQQQQAPVSVTITAITVLSDGSKIAVGHDGVILKSKADSESWQKVFTGFQLIKLKIASLQKQHDALQEAIATTQDEDEQEELQYQQEDLTFAIEDNQLELESGPNKPLLSITRTKQDILFATGAYGVLITSIDKGLTWQLISNRLENPDSFHLNAVISTAKGELYIVGENGLGFHSIDQGKTWSTITMPYTGSLFGIIAKIPDKTTDIQDTSSNNTTQLVAYGLQGNLMVSLDGGDNWQHKKLPTSASLLGGRVSSQGQVFLVGHGGLIVDFPITNLPKLRLQKHPSGAALSSVVIKDNGLILAGQFGISFWPLKERK